MGTEDELDELDNAIWKRMVDTANKKYLRDHRLHSAIVVGSVGGSGDQLKRPHGHGVGCASSLWGKLPLPFEKILTGSAPVDTCCNPALVGIPVPVQSKNVLQEDHTGELNAYADIPGNLQRYKQIFRDQARTKGFPRPSTPEITSK